jgi:molybdopterin/thiamine biosynthesis adenylyltransferase
MGIMLCPRIKFPHRPVRHGRDYVQIGGAVHGIHAGIMDPDGWVWALVQLLDGSRTVRQVVAELRVGFPDRSADMVQVAIAELIAKGYVEDAEEVVPVGMTDADRERYSRSRAWFQWVDLQPRSSSWDPQIQLRDATVAVIGLGGVGSTAALALTMSGAGHVHCVDRDVVELSDLNRQVLYTERDLGNPKWFVAVRRLREYNSRITVTGEQLNIDGPDAVSSLAAQFDVLLLAADEPAEIRSWTNRACHENDTTWVHGGYHGPLVSVGAFRPGTGPCYDCCRLTEQARRLELPPRTEWTPAAGTAPPQSANAVSAGWAGHLTALAVISLITGAPALPVNRHYCTNLVTLRDSVLVGPESPVPGCPTCGA